MIRFWTFKLSGAPPLLSYGPPAARFRLIDRSIREVTLRRDALCTRVTLDS
jgi:hypothetical protein